MTTCANCNKPTICGCGGNELNLKCSYYGAEDTLANINVEEDDNGEEILEKIDAAIGDILETVNGVVPESPTCPLTASTPGSTDLYVMTYNCTTGVTQWTAARLVTLT